MKKIAMFAAIAWMALGVTGCKPDSKDDPTPEYYLYASLIINPELEPYLHYVGVNYMLPGQDKKPEQLTFRMLTAKDEREYERFAPLYGYEADECKLVTFQKTFNRVGPVNLEFDIQVDSTCSVADTTNILMIAAMNINASAEGKNQRSVFYSHDVPQEDFYHSLQQKVYNIHHFWDN